MPWPSPHTDAQAARTMARALRGIAFGPIPALGMVWVSVLIGGMPTWLLFAGLSVVPVMFASFRMSRRFEQAYLLLEDT